MKVRTNKRWRNITRDYQLRAEKYFFPTKMEELSRIIQEAESNGKRVKAVGSGHSYSSVAVGSDYIVDLSEMRLVLPLRRDWLKPAFREPRGDLHLLEVESGITIEWLNKILERKELALINMGAIDEQTLAGAISTGTHGTGITLPSTPGMVRSLVLVAHQGKAYRIEPSEGITDPQTYDHPGIELIQDDHVFNSAVLSLGCMGIIYSFIIDIRDTYYLRETKTMTRWSEVRDRLQSGSFFTERSERNNLYRGMSVLVNPYEDESIHDYHAMIMRHEEIPQPERRTFNESLPNLLGRIGGTIPIGLWIALQTLYDQPRKMPQLLTSAMRSIQDKVYINKSHKVLHQGVEMIKNKALSAEFAIPINNPVRDFVVVTEEFFKKAAALSRENMYITSPLSLRFVSQSSAYLSLEHQGPVCYIDVPLLTKTPQRKRILDEFQDLAIRMGAFPHWGKANNMLEQFPGLILERFPNLHHWEQSFQRFNPAGTFDNIFTEQLKLGRMTTQA